MFCPSCRSDNQAEFTAEIMLHFHGLRNINNPGVLLFRRFPLLGMRLFEIHDSRIRVAEDEGSKRRV